MKIMAAGDGKVQKKQKVLLVHNFYQIGGGEHTVFENEKRLLRENGHKVIEYIRSNVELETSIRKKILLPFSSIFSFKTYREICEIIRKEGVDVVHCHNTFPLISPAVYYAAWKYKIPVVQTIHNFRFQCPCGVFYRDGNICEDCVKGGLGQALKHGCYRSSRIQTAVVINMLKIHRCLGTYLKLRYIFLTEFNREKFRPLLGNKVDHEFVKPNFEYIDIPEFSEAERNYNQFVFVARLDENKGVCFLLDAWKNISDKKLIIYGNGPLENEVRQAAAENSMIEYKGFRPKKEILADISQSAALVFTSKIYEGFPMTIVETIACGRPVLCSSVGNGADIVKNTKCGIHYNAGEPNDFYRKLCKLTEKEYNKELSDNAAAAYLKLFSPNENYKILKRIYDEVCSEKK